MTFFRVADLPSVDMMPGVVRRAVWLDRVMVTFFEFAPNTVIPTHDHPHEQITYVVEGEMEFTLGEETRRLRAGEGVCIPSGTPHGARILDRRTVALDAWHPPREDYK
ncbi:MAG TPA: cupin domain-containing protein [Thermoflexia bacterium]|jgi:quercetin dioxygenase-like cupin family protein|nr:cupin domain-containing protein [Thermoflexia bacterium]